MENVERKRRLFSLCVSCSARRSNGAQMLLMTAMIFSNVLIECFIKNVLWFGGIGRSIFARLLRTNITQLSSFKRNRFKRYSFFLKCPTAIESLSTRKKERNTLPLIIGERST